MKYFILFTIIINADVQILFAQNSTNSCYIKDTKYGEALIRAPILLLQITGGGLTLRLGRIIPSFVVLILV